MIFLLFHIKIEILEKKENCIPEQICLSIIFFYFDIHIQFENDAFDNSWNCELHIQTFTSKTCREKYIFTIRVQRRFNQFQLITNHISNNQEQILHIALRE